MSRAILCDVRHDQCRTPLWGNNTPSVDRMFVCGEPTLIGKSYCAACRDVLIAGEFSRGGKVRMFNQFVAPQLRMAAE